MKKVLAIVLSVAMLLSVFSVNVFAEEIELFSDPDGEDFLNEEWGQWNNDQEKYTFAPNDFFGTGNFWGRKAANILNISVDQVKELAKQDGVIFKYVFSGDTSGWWNDGASLTFDWSGPKAVVKITDIGGGKYEGTASLDELVDAWEANGKSIDDITALLIQVGYENFKLYSAKIITAPEEQGKVRIGDRYFDTLVEAVDAAKDGDTIYLLDNLEGAGIGIFAPHVKDFTIDFGGNTYTCVGSPVGSPGTESQAFHLEKSADKTPKVKLQNGTLTATTGSGVNMLIQNYCDLTLTNMNLNGMNLKGTEKTYVLSNNFGNTVIDGNTSITATDDNVAFDVCYANGSYADGVSVTLDTTGTITGDIELGTWNAAGGANPKPDINDYLKNANLIINNVKLEGKIINKVGGNYEPDPETYESEAGLELFISTMDSQSAPAVSSVTGITGPGQYTISYTPGDTITSYDWIMLKSKGSEGTSVAGSPIPAGTVIRTSEVKINGKVIPFPNEAEYVDYTVGANGAIELKYYFSLNWGGEVFVNKPSDTIESIEITFELLENEKTAEEIKAEYNKKLQSAIDINGGIFAADSNVDDYLPEGEYETDEDGNILVGDVQLPSVNMHDNNRITGCVYLNEDYHALIVNGRFIAQPHVDNGTGFCVACKGAINK